MIMATRRTADLDHRENQNWNQHINKYKIRFLLPSSTVISPWHWHIDHDCLHVHTVTKYPFNQTITWDSLFMSCKHALDTEVWPKRFFSHS